MLTPMEQGCINAASALFDDQLKVRELLKRWPGTMTLDEIDRSAEAKNDELGRRYWASRKARGDA